MAHHGLRFGSKTGVKRRLTATGLLFPKFAFVADAFENIGHREPDTREELVD